MTSSSVLLASLLTLASAGAFAGSALAAPPAPEPLTLPAISADVQELAICSRAGTLRSMGLLDVPVDEVRDDRPLVVLRDRYDLRYASWTRPGEETPTTSGELGEAAPAPLTERVDLSKEGCWFWTRSPGGVAHIGSDNTVRAWLGAEALAEGLSISAASLRPPVEAKHMAPRTTWTPDAVQRFMMATNPIPEPKKSEGALAPNGMMRMVLGHCPQWAPGVTLAVAQGGMALFCPMEAPKKALAGIAAKVKKGEDVGEADEVSVHLKGVFSMMPRIVLVDGGLVFTSDAAVFEELRQAALGTPAGAGWWDDETPTTGLWMKAPQAVVSVVPDGTLNRAEMVMTSLEEFALLDSTTIKVSTLKVEPREELDAMMEDVGVEGGVSGGVLGGERVEPVPEPPLPGAEPAESLPTERANAQVLRHIMPPSSQVEGVCTAVFTIDRRGRPSAVTVSGEQCPEGYEEEARPTLLKWRFHPAKDDAGQATESTFITKIRLVVR